MEFQFKRRSLAQNAMGGASAVGTGAGVICRTSAQQRAVIPAKAGIQLARNALPKACQVDSRFRGNDRGKLAGQRSLGM